jgi:hypothetical protein
VRVRVSGVSELRNVGVFGLGKRVHPGLQEVSVGHRGVGVCTFDRGVIDSGWVATGLAVTLVQPVEGA